ncbi:hypothetical protein GLW04_11805 [Halobacillus litoralis]|uniref:Uncharacterized protein n=1 Tax=Halobacillus litoralis TaxID=45668 RepID=A0A845DSW0_9BACI|nr:MULTISPECIES: hypothetical protein [Halobacillus]MYL20580.1 hypothetical protein [Halobacillus litoralis]MYL29670.1 hypothetical protein [Halobacillus halophilus]
MNKAQQIIFGLAVGAALCIGVIAGMSFSKNIFVVMGTGLAAGFIVRFVVQRAFAEMNKNQS